MDNVVVTLDRHGNTSAASVPVRWMKRFAMAASSVVS
jgi:3-oxoacyl-[acyl-carrier-protein] synthase III